MRASRPLREDLVTQACLEVYGAIRHEGRLADRALDFTLRHQRHLYSLERRTVAERIYALLRRQITVDWLLERARDGFGKLPAARADALRLAASRVLEGEPWREVARVSALVPADAGALGKLRDAGAELERQAPEVRFALKYSLPPFLAAAFREELGDEAEDAMAAMNVRAPLTARANTLKGDREVLAEALSREEVDSRPTPYSPFGLELLTHQNAFSLDAFRQGRFELQDEGSQLLGMLVDAPPTRVVDACAGAGGKALQLSAQMRNKGELFALDVDERRLGELRRRANRAGAFNIRIRVIPAEDVPSREALSDLTAKADRVLVDSPCSGTGTFRRKPDARYHITPELLADHVARQKALLDRYAPLVKPGGRLIYGTCSVLRVENEAVVEDFLARNEAFRLVPISDRIGEPLASKVGRDGYLRTFPHRHGTDGFFGAILERRARGPT